MLLVGIMVLGVLISGCGKPKIEGWGEYSNGLVMKLNGPAVAEVDGSFEVALDIKNLDAKPITIEEGVAEYFPLQLNITDEGGRAIQWTSHTPPVTIAPPPITLAPKENYHISKHLERDGAFSMPLESGMKLKMKAVYEKTTGTNWKGKLISNELAVSVGDNFWGEAVDGIHCYLMSLPESVKTGEPLLLRVVIENTNPDKPLVLRASPDNKTRPQLDVEIISLDNKVIFKSKRKSSDAVSFVTINPGEKLYTDVIPCSADIQKVIDALKPQQSGVQRAYAAENNMKLSKIPSGLYNVAISYTHIVGKKDSQTWKKGWSGSFRSNAVVANFINTAPPEPPQPPVYSIEIKPTSGKVKTVKSAKTVENIKKAMGNLKPLKTPSKAKVKGTVTILADGKAESVYSYAAGYLLKEGDETQYQIPESLKSQLPK